MKVNISGQGQHVEEKFSGEMSLHPLQLSMTVDLPDDSGVLDERAAGHTMYMRLGDHLTSEGRHWVSLATPDTSNALGSSSDPLGSLRLLSGATGAVTRVGRQKIGGVQTTHYRAVVDPAIVLSRVPDSLKLEGTDAAVAGVGPFPVDVYIADDGTVRRVKDKVKTQGVTAAVEMTLRTLGHPVSVTVPPASDVTRVSSLTEVFQELGVPVPTG
jgi:hypothetical protein